MRLLAPILPLLLIPLLSIAAQAAPIVFPMENPAFSFSLPDGWVQQVSPKGNLLAQPAGGPSIRVVMFALPPSIGSESAAQRGLDGFARGNAMALGIVGLTPDHAPQTLKINDAVTMITTDYAGKLPDGTPAAYSVGFFAAGRGRYFGIVVAGSTAADRASAEDQAAILHSLTLLPPPAARH